MRILFLKLSFIFLFVVVLARLFYLQILNNEYYQIVAERQHTAEKTVWAQRGDILTSDGFVLATNEDAYLLYASPHKIKQEEKQEIALRLAKLLPKDPRFFSYNTLPKEVESIEKYLTTFFANQLGLDKFWVALANKIPESQKDEIESWGFEGLGFQPQDRRFYPEERLASTLLGFVGFDERGEDQGYFGLEGYYNGDLKGIAGKVLEERSSRGEPILVGGYEVVEPKDGRSIYLTISRSLQYTLERKLEQGVKKYGAYSGTFIVMEPDTGKIAAMGSFPNFNPAAFSPPPKETSREGKGEFGDGEEKNIYEDNFRNLAISESYEPGSVLKALTMSAAIDSGKVTPDTTFEDNGPLRIGGYSINTWNGRHYGTQTMIELLQKSNNVGAAVVAQWLGKEVLREYFLKFGLGETTGIDLEGEEKGTVKPLGEWRDIDLATAAFGQGIAVTPLQLVSSFSSIVNGGKLVRPYLVEKIVDENGSEIVFKPKVVGQVMSENSSVVMIGMLTQAVEGGEARKIIKSKYTIAGKTGTAQIPFEGTYDPNKTNATFIGFLPYNPKFVMLVKLEKPSTSVYAAETAVPLWVEMMHEVASFYGIPPDK